MSIKRTALVCLILVMALGAFGCGEDNQEKEVSKKEIVVLYNTMNNTYRDLIDYYEAVNNKKITKFDWRIIAESSKSQCNRLLERTKASEDPVIKEFPGIINDILSLAKEMEGYIDHGTEPDLSYKEKIEDELEALKPEIDRIKKEVLEEQK